MGLLVSPGRSLRAIVVRRGRMTLGSMNHLGIPVSDLAASTVRFYAPLLGFLGSRLVEEQPQMSLWQFGRASCRERVGRYVLISVVAVSFNTNIGEILTFTQSI